MPFLNYDSAFEITLSVGLQSGEWMANSKKNDYNRALVPIPKSMIYSVA